jgi:hypothetical protein
LALARFHLLEEEQIVVLLEVEPIDGGQPFPLSD